MTGDPRVGVSATQGAAALMRACPHLLARLEALEARVQAGEESAWSDYLSALNALVAILPHLVPGAHGEALSTKDMAARLGVKPKTLLRWRKAGKVGGAVQLGARGRAAIRWTDGNGGGNPTRK